MTASVGEKRKRLNGRVFEEPSVIPCTAEELNHVLDKWIDDEVVRPFTVSKATNGGRKEESLILQDS